MPILEVNSVSFSLGCSFTYNVMHLIKKKKITRPANEKGKKKIDLPKEKAVNRTRPRKMARMLKLPGKNLNNGSELLKIYHTNVRRQ